MGGRGQLSHLAAHDAGEVGGGQLGEQLGGLQQRAVPGHTALGLHQVHVPLLEDGPNGYHHTHYRSKRWGH